MRNGLRGTVNDLLERRGCRTEVERRIALRDIVQEIVMLGLSRAGFFLHVALSGSAALHHFHGMERYVDRLCFVHVVQEMGKLLQKCKSFIQDELGAQGIDLCEWKEENVMQPDESGNCLRTSGEPHSRCGDRIRFRMKALSAGLFGMEWEEPMELCLSAEHVKGATSDMRYGLSPVPYSIRVRSACSLFTELTGGVLDEKGRVPVAGWDLADLCWCLSRNIPVDLAYLGNLLVASGILRKNEALSRNMLLHMLRKRFQRIDLPVAASEIEAFHRDRQGLALWSFEFFESILHERLVTIP